MQINQLDQSSWKITLEELIEEILNSEKTTPLCKHCGEKMVIRVNQKLDNHPKFWGCRNFPRCKYTEEITRFNLQEEETFTFLCDTCLVKVIEKVEIGSKIVEKLICHPLEFCPLRGSNKKPKELTIKGSFGVPKRKIRIEK